jgi:electron transfer flavoprotein beta subunit
VKILVCAKQVPDPDQIIIMPVENNGHVAVGDFSGYRMNRFDEFAVEAAVRIKEKTGAVIDVITVGSAHSNDVIRRAMGMGADNGIHLEIPGKGYVSPLITATGIADFARNKGYSLILTGAMSEDMMNSQVGPMTASLLNLPWATQVISIRLSMGDSCDTSGFIDVERETEGGCREMLKMAAPALLAVQTGINEPRYPSLSNLLRANKQEILSIPLKVTICPEEMAGMAMPSKIRAARHLAGSAAEKARQLLSIMREKAFLK